MDRKEYMGELAKLNARPPTKEPASQKFKRGSRVRIAKDLGRSMSHFDNDQEVIVQYTYKQKFRCGNVKSYSVLLLDENGLGCNTSAWYEEHQLTLVSDDVQAGLVLLEAYKYGGD